MYSLADAVRRLWRRNVPSSAKPRRLVPVLISALVLVGTATGVVLATVGGKPAAVGAAAAQPIPRTSPAPSKTIGPVVPMLGGSADASGTPITVPVARAPASASTASASTAPASTAPASTASPTAKRAPVAPLRGLKQADLLVVAPFSLSGKVRAAVARQSGVTGTEPIEAAKIKINGTFTAVLGVNPSSFRGYTAPSTAASNKLWQAVARGGVAVSYTMGTLDRLSLGGQVTVSGRDQERRLPVMAFGTVGIGGVDAVVSDSVAASLGVPARNALVVSAPPASVASIAARIKAVLPKGASVEPLVTEVTRPGGASPVGIVPGTPAGGALTAAQLTTALRAAESRRGLPYVWGAAGPSSFDCSGLVEWSFAQAGISMPRVAADQARTGLSVPVTRLQPGDLLFYHTDPTDPGYISHVAIYLGNGWMIQAPQPGMDVEIVPARFGSQFAGAVRVYPRIAAGLAPGLA
jgi:cell wall-associated NlpC family hydrolase